MRSMPRRTSWNHTRSRVLGLRYIRSAGSCTRSKSTAASSPLTTSEWGVASCKVMQTAPRGSPPRGGRACRSTSRGRGNPSRGSARRSDTDTPSRGPITRLSAPDTTRTVQPSATSCNCRRLPSCPEAGSHSRSREFRSRVIFSINVSGVSGSGAACTAQASAAHRASTLRPVDQGGFGCMPDCRVGVRSGRGRAPAQRGVGTAPRFHRRLALGLLAHCTPGVWAAAIQPRATSAAPVRCGRAGTCGAMRMPSAPASSGCRPPTRA